jgi:hypothetical protein
MNTLIIVFLGIIALAALVNAVVFAALAVAARKATSGLDTLSQTAERRLPEWGAKVSTWTGRLAGYSAKAAALAHDTEPKVQAAAEAAQRTTGRVRSAIHWPFASSRNALVMAHALQRAFEVYNRPRPQAP